MKTEVEHISIRKNFLTANSLNHPVKEIDEFSISQSLQLSLEGSGR